MSRAAGLPAARRATRRGSAFGRENQEDGRGRPASFDPPCVLVRARACRPQSAKRLAQGVTSTRCRRSRCPRSRENEAPRACWPHRGSRLQNAVLTARLGCLDDDGQPSSALIPPRRAVARSRQRRSARHRHEARRALFARWRRRLQALAPAATCQGRPVGEAPRSSGGSSAIRALRRRRLPGAVPSRPVMTASHRSSPRSMPAVPSTTAASEVPPSLPKELRGTTAAHPVASPRAAARHDRGGPPAPLRSGAAEPLRRRRRAPARRSDRPPSPIVSR